MTRSSAGQAKKAMTNKKTGKSKVSKTENKISKNIQEQPCRQESHEENDFIQLAREAYTREQERIRSKAKMDRKASKLAGDKRCEMWLKENPGKTKYQYQKHRKEQLTKMISGVKAQTRFLRLSRQRVTRR